ncbi:epidermal growth factor-like protein 7 isoform X2 [Protopterus annectens]|uniref:epidermal growth factor-like protein 7 isoform X2 n=1 Tax=Protopterus annectens TaxID=7888 RepID=UPI001CFA6AB4|nr:epidermal growth factor-like protein 7 isoform X2 [Protopterus annectens]
MKKIVLLITELAVIFFMNARGFFLHTGRRICAHHVQNTFVSYMESYTQPVYKPYVMMCKGQRLCTTYRTMYKTVYRTAYKMVPQPVYVCCPGWRRPHANADSCTQDVDECYGQQHGCAHHCVNTAGSYRCECQNGYKLSENGKSCKIVEEPLQNKTKSSTGTVTSDLTKEELQELKNRVDVLEQKLQLALTPIQSLVPGLGDLHTAQTSLLQHTIQQLDRIDSLSEQISFLEERLETCPCQGKL